MEGNITTPKNEMTMDSGITYATTEIPRDITDSDNAVFALTIASLCIGAINSAVLIILIIWLCRHPKLRDQSEKKKNASPKKILTIDYRMSEINDEVTDMAQSVYRPQQQVAFTIGQYPPREGEPSSNHLPSDRGEIEMGRYNQSFIAGPENLTPNYVYENTRIPLRVS